MQTKKSSGLNLYKSNIEVIIFWCQLSARQYIIGARKWALFIHDAGKIWRLQEFLISRDLHFDNARIIQRLSWLNDGVTMQLFFTFLLLISQF